MNADGEQYICHKTHRHPFVIRRIFSVNPIVARTHRVGKQLFVDVSMRPNLTLETYQWPRGRDLSPFSSVFNPIDQLKKNSNWKQISHLHVTNNTAEIGQVTNLNMKSIDIRWRSENWNLRRRNSQTTHTRVDDRLSVRKQEKKRKQIIIVFFLIDASSFALMIAHHSFFQYEDALSSSIQPIGRIFSLALSFALLVRAEDKLSRSIDLTIISFHFITSFTQALHVFHQTRIRCFGLDQPSQTPPVMSSSGERRELLHRRWDSWNDRWTSEGKLRHWTMKIDEQPLWSCFFVENNLR